MTKPNGGDGNGRGAHPRLLMIGWDAADWKVASPLVDRGELPNLQRLIESGVMADLATMQPPLSPMLWTTIATGHRPDTHGILGFTELDPETDEVRPSTCLSRRCRALWNIASQTGRQVRVVNWLASHPAEPVAGVCVSDAITQGTDHAVPPVLAPGTVHPATRHNEFAALRIGASEIDAETIALFVPRLAEVDQDKDRQLAVLARLLAETLTVHQAALAALTDEWDFAAVYYPGIDHFSHGFMHYHPPALVGTDPKQATLYGDVVNSAYRLHDLLLGRLLALAGPETSIILLSDHGFHSDHLRQLNTPNVPAGPTVHHRDHGVLVMTGPEIRQDKRIYGAGLLDIAPTALALMGLPVGADMPGRVLTEAFSEPPRYEVVPSWETVAGEAGRHPPGVRVAAGEIGLLIEQFAALGYLDPTELTSMRGPDAVQRELDWNLARSFADQQQPERAIAILERLCSAWPERSDFGLALCDAMCAIGAPDAAWELAEAMLGSQRDGAQMHYVLGMIAAAKGEAAEALRHLRAAVDAQPGLPAFHAQIGFAALRLNDLLLARETFTIAIALDPDLAPARTGLATCAIAAGDWQTAQRHALAAVAVNFQAPMAHMLLGDARLRQGQWEAADLSLAVACQLAPDWVPPRALRAQMWRAVPAHPRAAETAKALAEAARRTEARAVAQAAYRNAARDSAWRLLRQTYTRQAQADAAKTAGDHLATAGPLDIVLVSGLPRSGTSLMMQMLALGGAPILSDNERAADADNPEGYLEWRPLSRLPTQPEILRAAAGKVVKLLTPMVAYLPGRHRYRVLFLDRPIDEVVASQLAMRARIGRPAATAPARLRAALATHRSEALSWLRNLDGSVVLAVAYRDLLNDPTASAARIAAWLGADMVPYPERMAGAVRNELYRQRGDPPAPG
jgi:predicted AlkP superfamily phosphohydrolase/phosphomutase/tetratricopeptide (TPR) repeat protein